MKRIIDLRKAGEVKYEDRSEAAGKPMHLLMQKISWHGPLFNHHPDMTAIWVVAGLFWVTAALIQFFQNNIITTMFFAMVGLVIIIHAKKRPALGEIEITPLGIKLGERSYNFKELRSFWINYQPSYRISELSLQIKKWYMPYLKVPLGEQNPVQIRSLLIQFIPEVEHEETLTDILARRLGL